MRSTQPSIILPLFIWSSALAGPLKFCSSLIGVPIHLLPKALLLLVIVKPFVLLHANLRQCVVGALILMLCVIGLQHHLPAKQVLFGVWALLPFIFGMLFPRLVIAACAHRNFIILFFVCVIGEALSYFVTFPWAGMNTEFGGVTTMVAREWSDGGAKRLAGFATSSHDLSIMLAVLGIFFIFQARTFMSRAAIMLLITGLIIATTMKTTAIAFLLACLPLLASSKFLRVGSGVASLLCMLMGTLIPFLLSDPLLARLTHFVRKTSALQTLEERFDHTWPGVIIYLRHAEVGFSGIGLGGLGSATSVNGIIFADASVDNLYLYILGTAGWVGALFLAVYAGKIFRAAFGRNDPQTPFRLPLMVFFSIYGISQSPMEISVGAIFLGAIVAFRRGSLPLTQPILRKVPISVRGGIRTAT